MQVHAWLAFVPAAHCQLILKPDSCTRVMQLRAHRCIELGQHIAQRSQGAIPLRRVYVYSTKLDEATAVRMGVCEGRAATPNRSTASSRKFGVNSVVELFTTLHRLYVAGDLDVYEIFRIKGRAWRWRRVAVEDGYR